MCAATDWDAFVTEPAAEPVAGPSEEDVLSLTVRLALLEDIGRLVVAGSDLDRLLHQILALCESVVEAEAASILLVDERTGELGFAAATGEKADAVKRLHLSPGEGIAGWVAQHGEPLLVPSPVGDERWSSRVDELTGFRTASVICVPVQLQDRVVGVLELINKIGADRFSEADTDLLATVAAQAALLIENARLLKRLEEDKRRFHLLLETMRLAGDQWSPQDLLNRILTVARDALHANTCLLYTSDAADE